MASYHHGFYVINRNYNGLSADHMQTAHYTISALKIDEKKTQNCFY